MTPGEPVHDFPTGSDNYEWWPTAAEQWEQDHPSAPESFKEDR